MVDAVHIFGVSGVVGSYLNEKTEVSFRFFVEFAQRLQDDII